MRRALVLLAVLGWSMEAQAFPGEKLPRSGSGFFTPETWALRGLRWGRPELIGLIERAAQRVASRFGGSRLYVADLSMKNGSVTQWHASHRNGCDVDLIFYALEENGHLAAPPSQMVVYDERGIGTAQDGRTLRFDVKRNWALVKALIMDPRTEVIRIFVAEPLRRRLLAHGEKVGDEPELLGKAGELMAQPGDSGAHDDHFHVRIMPRFDAARRGSTPARASSARPPAKGSSRPRR